MGNIKNKLVLVVLQVISIGILNPVFADPLALTDWKQPLTDKSVKYDNYTSVLNCDKKTPYYVFYNLNTSDFEPVNSRRKNKWPTSVPEEIKAVCGKDYATTRDYRNSDYDRGHLAPAANFQSSQYAKDLTFSFANAAPQYPFLNQVLWKCLEENERQLARDHAGITVITGVIQSKNKYIGRKVGVPDYFYKIILWKEKEKIKSLIFLNKNDETDMELNRVDMNLLKTKTGLDFGIK